MSTAVLICSGGDATRLHDKLNGKTKCLGDGTLLQNQIDYWKQNCSSIWVQVKRGHLAQLANYPGIERLSGKWSTNAFAVYEALSWMKRYTYDRIWIQWGDLLFFDSQHNPSEGVNVYTTYNEYSPLFRYVVSEHSMTRAVPGTVPGLFCLEGREFIEGFVKWMKPQLVNEHSDFCDILSDVFVNELSIGKFVDIGDVERWEAYYGKA